ALGPAIEVHELSSLRRRRREKPDDDRGTLSHKVFLTPPPASLALPSLLASAYHKHRATPIGSKSAERGGLPRRGEEMPAFYRIPIVSFGAIRLAGVFALGTLGRGERRSDAPRDRPIEPNAQAQAEPKAPETEGPPSHEPDDAILRTAEGLRRKVVVKDLGI